MLILSAYLSVAAVIGASAIFALDSGDGCGLSIYILPYNVSPLAGICIGEALNPGPPKQECGGIRDAPDDSVGSEAAGSASVPVMESVGIEEDHEDRPVSTHTRSVCSGSVERRM